MKSRCLRVHKQDKTVESRIEEIDVSNIGAGEVLIKVEYSGLNYKDALAVTGTSPIIRKYPLIAGIDLSGEVVESSDAAFKPGDKVLANGCGIGEEHDGGFSEYARLPAEWTIPLSAGLTTKQAMTLGTARFTAALAIYRMEVNGQNPDLGPVVVTGASGGVGSFAVNMLSKNGYQVIAVSGREQQHQRLKELGANEVVTAEQLQLSSSPLQKMRFGGGIDNVGGELLAKIIASTNLWGNVASIGVAGGTDLNAAVFPFILRGVSLLGVSSANCPIELRRALWERLGDDLKPDDNSFVESDEIGLEGIVSAAGELLGRKRFGRTIVKID
jgi:NADPH2:quinone reductase